MQACQHRAISLWNCLHESTISVNLLTLWPFGDLKGTSAWHLPRVWQEVPFRKKNRIISRGGVPYPRGPSETSWGMTVTLLVFQIPMMLHDKSCLSCLWFIETFIVVDWNHCHPLCLVTFNWTLLTLSSRGLSGHLLLPHHHHHVRHHLWLSTATEFCPTALEFYESLSVGLFRGLLWWQNDIVYIYI